MMDEMVPSHVMLNPVIAVTAENAFIFHLFQFILTGLILAVTFWFWRRESSASADPRIRTLLAALTLLCANFSLGCLGSLWSFYSYEPIWHPGLGLARSALEPVSFLLLGSSFLLFRPGRRLVILLGGLAVILVAALLAPGSVRWATSLCQAVSLVILLSVALILVRRGLRRELLRILAFGFLAVAVIASLLETVRLASSGAPSQALWGVYTFFTLGALVLLAFIVERMWAKLPVQFFLRLNLLFIFLAGLLMVEVTESTRRQHLDFAERELQHLSEYLRGHAIHFSSLGYEDAEILRNEEITRRIVSDFGKIPEMRTVAISLPKRRVDFMIDEGGVITRRWLPASESGNGAPYPSHRIVGSLLRTSLPIMDADRVLGSVEITKSLETMNKRIAQALIVIFSSFTFTVLLSAALIGLIVNRADRTMKDQYHRIENTQRQLMQAAKLASIGELAGGVAHEINNPLGIILGRADYLKALAEQQRIPPSYIEDIEAIQRQTRRMSRIVSDLLTFSHRHPLERVPLRLNEVIHRSLEIVKPRIREKRIHLQTSLEQGLPPVYGDRDRLEQVFLNVLNNAVDALAGGGTILVQTGATGDEAGQKVYARFADTGIGIAHENLKKIFDPFFSTKEEGKGTGLGLSISYGIVRDHMGRMDVESEPGRGTTFTITFPAGTTG